MNKNEFLKTLKESLSGTLEKDAIKEQLDYYEKYIDDEVNSGKTEKEVLDELGDPRLIAKTIKTVSVADVSSESKIGNEKYRGEHDESTYGESKRKRTAYSNYGNNGRGQGGYMDFNKDNATIGCIIFLLVVFIIVYGVLRYLGRIAFSGPVGFLLVAGLLYLLFGRGKR